MRRTSNLNTLPGLACCLMLAFGMNAQSDFKNRAPIPPLIDADSTIELVMGITTNKFNPTKPSNFLNGGFLQPTGIPTFSYSKAVGPTNPILGPTLIWHKGQNVHIRLTNNIGQPTTTHWHGAEVASRYDGGPHQPIMPDSTWDITFPILDNACTLWYHPHFHDHTLEHVQMGLSGLIIVEDEDDQMREILPHTYGVDDIPVIIGDLGLRTDTLSFNPLLVQYFVDTLKAKRPNNLVNGINNPYLDVPAHVVRFRILNGSTRKGVKYGFSDSYSGPLSELKEFNLIGTDGGYVIKSDKMTSLLNGPGSRDEVVIDLSSYSPGDSLYLRNLNSDMPKFIVGSTLSNDPTLGDAFLMLKIKPDSFFTKQTPYTPITSFTPFVRNWEPELQDTTNGIVRTRTKHLVGSNTTQPHGFTIDGTSFDINMLNDTVCVDTKEIWEIINDSPVAHPFHIHKIQFRILSVTDATGTELDLESLGFNGPKDDVLVEPNWTVRFMGNFSEYPDPILAQNGYMYHCHILTHEDILGGGMMHQFVVTNEGICAAMGATEQLTLQSMLLFPNPTSGELTLRSAATKPSIVRILDIQGRVLKTQTLPAFNGNANIDTAGLPKGLYMVEWRTHAGTITKKLIMD